MNEHPVVVNVIIMIVQVDNDRFHIERLDGNQAKTLLLI
jgi:hypothetical protein